jgi:integrase
MRMPQPWFRKQNQTWYVELNGKQHNLGKDREAAFDEYHRLMVNGVPDRNWTVRQVLDAYWNWAKSNLAATTVSRREGVLKSFGESVPANLKASQLKGLHVQRWLDANDWNATTQHNYITLISGIINWAIGLGYMEKNRIKIMRKPTPVVRQEFLPANLWPRVLKLATDQEFRDYLIMMLATGARPQELPIIEAKYFDGEKIVLPADKSKGRKRSRVIYLPPEALEIVKRLSAEYPQGPLLRNTKGNPWNKDSVNCRFKRLKRELKEPKLCATTLRHSYAHHRLTSGQDALTVSKLMGHVDTRMIATRYGHLDANTDYMQGAANGIGFPLAADCTADTL